MILEQHILEILNEHSKIEGNSLKLTCGQLERNTYLAVNKVLEAIGGKWNRKTQAHIFDSEVEDRLERVLLTGRVDIPRNENFGYFPTPKHIVDEMLEYAEIEEGLSILEPSAGQGHILDEIGSRYCRDLTAIENLSQNIEVLQKKGYSVINQDFLTYNARQFDRIIMNPPFAKMADVKHILHAWELLKNNGILVSIGSSGIIFRQEKLYKELRDIIDEFGKLKQLPEESFKESGTSVNTIIIKLEKHN